MDTLGLTWVVGLGRQTIVEPQVVQPARRLHHHVLKVSTVVAVHIPHDPIHFRPA